MSPAALPLSVVIPTHNRPAGLERLLQALAAQTLRASEFEVVVVDDGSREPVRGRVEKLPLPYRLVVVSQPQRGAAMARDAGVRRATGEIVVFLDDDMRPSPDLLASHLRLHEATPRAVVFGHIEPDAALETMPLFERYHAAMLDRWVRDVTRGAVALEGQQLCTGNVSMRRSDYLGVGGFDATLLRSEDAELGLRLAQAGCTLVFGEDARARHGSDHTSLGVWMDRAFRYGVYDLRIARKHAGVASASPWRFLFLVHPLSRPLLLGSALFPELARPVARVAMQIALALDRVGAERPAIAGTTLVYGMEYFRGVRRDAGGRGRMAADLLRYLMQRSAAARDFWGAVHADWRIIQHYDAKYKGGLTTRSPSTDAVRKIGFQIMIAYRVMRFLRASGHLLGAQVVSRLMRHLYAADIHWDAELAPGVMIVHGVGLVIGHGVKVGHGCILSQHVTLGEGIDPERRIGSPELRARVHVGPGAVVLGPISLGVGAKIGANACVVESVPGMVRVDAAHAPRTSRLATAQVANAEGSG